MLGSASLHIHAGLLDCNLNLSRLPECEGVFGHELIEHRAI